MIKVNVNNSVPLSVNNKLGAARHVACEVAPYLRAALYALVPVPTPGLGTFATTETMVMRYDPACVEAWTIEYVALHFLHEVLHPLRDHFGRCRALGADRALYNVAADMEIDDDLIAMGFKLDDEWLLPKHIKMPDGKTAEEYYRQARQMEQSGGCKCKPDKPKTGAGWCGSAGGNPVPGEDENAVGQDEKGDGENQGNAAGRSQGEVERVRQQVAEATIEHAKSRGSVPGGMLRWAEKHVKPPKVRWQDELARAVRSAIAYRAGAVDYTRSRPSRRQAALDRVCGRRAPRIPAMRAPVPRVSFWMDTSGSMSKDELDAGIREASGVLRAVGADIDFLAVDAAIQDVRRVRHAGELLQHLKGGGGTDFRAPFMALPDMRRKLGHDPELVIYCTDGIGPAPSAPPPGIQVIWLLVGQHQQRPYCDGGTVQWGKFISIKPEEEAA